MEITKKCILALVATALTGCASSRHSFSGPEARREFKRAALTVREITDNGDSFRARFRFENRTAKQVMFDTKEIKCSKGGMNGKASFGSGEEMILVSARQEKDLELICKFRVTGSSGAFRIRIEQVYEQPLGADDESSARVVMNDLEWTSAN